MASFLLPCCFFITNDITCTPECLTAPFFPNHTATQTAYVDLVFTNLYILLTLDYLHNHRPRFFSTVSMKNLFHEAFFCFTDPVPGNHGRFKALQSHARRLENRVVALEAENQQPRLALLDQVPRDSTREGL